MKHIKLILAQVINFFQFFDKNTIWIDGGLGSQIICYMRYFNELKTNPKAKCNTSFYLIPKTDSRFQENLTHRDWMLNYYGLEFKDLNDCNNKKGIRPSIDFQGKQLLDFLKNYSKQIILL